MSKMGLWVQIPDNSWVRVWVEAGPNDVDPGFTADAVFHSDSGGEQDLLDLHEKPRRRKLHVAQNYSVRVTVTFASQSRAFVLAEVEDADGQPIPEVFSGANQFRSSAVSGAAGSAKSVTLFLVTQEGAGGGVQ